MSANNSLFTFTNNSGFTELTPRPDYPCVGSVKLDLDADPEKVFKVKNAFGKSLPDEVQYRELPLKMTTVQTVQGDGGPVTKRITFAVNLDGAYAPADQSAYFHPSLQERDLNGRKMSNDRATTGLLAALGMPSGTYLDVVTRLASGAEVPAVFYPSRPGLQAEMKPLSEKAMNALIARSPGGVISDERPQPKKKGGAAAEGVAAPKEDVVE